MVPPGKIAAIMLTPHRHDSMRDQDLPTKEFVDTVNALAKSEGFLIIVDDIRCGFRLKLSGSADHYGYNADLQCFGKAMANGYPIAPAILGMLLGVMLEEHFITSMIKADGNLLGFVERPIAAGLAVCTVLLWSVSGWLALRRHLRRRQSPAAVAQ